MRLPDAWALRYADLHWQDAAVKNKSGAFIPYRIAGRVMQREVRDWDHASAEHRQAAARALVRAASQRYVRGQPRPP